jgi:DNA-binding NarL/FixJ family response regulator
MTQQKLAGDWSKEKVTQEYIRVLIADDVPLVRQGLATMLKLTAKNSSPHIEVIGEAKNGFEAILQAQKLQPDVVLMDLEMPLLDGFEATRQIKTTLPATRVIILSIHAGPDKRKLAQLAGADCFIEKSSPLDGLLQAILGNL